MNYLVSYLIFFSTVFFCFSAGNIYFIWLLMELNIFSVLVMSTLGMIEELESKLYFYFVQIVSSFFLLISIFSSDSQIYLEFFFAVKLGLYPLYFWYVYLMHTSLIFIYLVTSVQKIFVFLILSTFILTPLVFMLSLLTLTGVLYAFSQSNFKLIFVFSSVFHMSWLSLCFFSGVIYWVFYLIIYIFMSTYIFLYFLPSVSFFISFQSVFSLDKMFFLISISGFPPFLAFVPKLIVIIQSDYFVMVLFIYLIFTLLNMGLYMRLLIFLMLVNSMLYKHFLLNYQKKTFFFFSFFLILLV